MEENENEGMSTGKKVVAGAAIGVAVPAAVGVAKKLIGDSDDEEEGGGDAGRSQQGGRSTARSSSSSRSRSSGTKKRTGSTAKSGSQRKTGSGSSSRASGSRARSGTSRSRSTRSTSSSSRGSSSSSSGGSNRTKEQLYNQAKRMGIEGRSTMTKAQLERAINRARSRS
jgi:hypothetical protein